MNLSRFLSWRFYLSLFLALLLSSQIFADTALKKILQEDFYVLEGKKTEFWKNVQRPEDKLFLKKCAALYENNKSLLLTRGYEEKIPRKIHFIWLGPQAFPHPSVENVRNWMARHPDWQFYFWTDRDRLAPCEGMILKSVDPSLFPHLLKEYESGESWGEKSDILRYEILYQEGGVYVDHDADCLRSFDSLVENFKLVCGLQVPREGVESTAWRSIIAANGLIAVAPGHPCIARGIEILQSRWDSSWGHMSVFEKTIARSFLPFSIAVEEFVLHHPQEMLILPAAFFYPQGALPKIYSVHAFAASWVPKNVFTSKEALALQKSFADLERKAYALIIGQFLCLSGFLAIGMLLYKGRKRAMAVCLLFLLTGWGNGLSASPKEDFEEMMGKTAPEIWKHVKTAEDRKWLAYFSEQYTAAPPTLEVEYQSMRIPPIVHFIWLSFSPPPEEIVKNIKSWIHLHPNWTVKIWTEGRSFPLDAKISWGDVRTLPKNVSIPDTDTLHALEYQEILRQTILLHEGGVVIDPQLQCRRSLKPLHGRYDFYATLEVPKKTHLGSSVAFSTAILGAKPQHPFIRTTLEGLSMRWDILKKSDPGSDLKALKRLAARRMDDSMKRAFKLCSVQHRGTAVILPAGYFQNLASKKGVFSVSRPIKMEWNADRDIEVEYGHSIRKIRKKIAFISYWTGGIAGIVLCLSFYFFGRAQIDLFRD